MVTDDGVARLADFGLIFVIDHGQFTTSKIAGPARWSAPEILDPPEDEETISDEIHDPQYTKAGDMFAFSMLLIEVRSLRGGSGFPGAVQWDLHFSMSFRPLRRNRTKRFMFTRYLINRLLSSKMFTCKAPFSKIRNDSAVIFRILKRERPDMPEILNEKPEIATIIRKCWEHDAKDRPSAREVKTELKCLSAPSWPS